MKVNLKQAIKMFFGNSSLEMVYFESIANSLDAGATEINISISIEATSKPKTLEIEISDNGIGLNNDRFNKFSNLFEVEEDSHKGLGRLVYLCYFEKIEVTSFFNKTKRREFTFTENFEGDSDYKVTDVDENSSGTVFKMQHYNLKKIAKNDYLFPKYIKNRIIEVFITKLFRFKESQQPFRININSNIENHNYSEIITETDIPLLTEKDLQSSVSLIDKFYLYYSIQKTDELNSSLIAAISIDDRTYEMDIIADENRPVGYRMVFLLFSDFFIGKTEPGRRDINISNVELQSIKEIFREAVANLLRDQIPEVRQNKEDIEDFFTQHYPHLKGLFNNNNIGFASRRDVLKEAQDNFFKEQKEILDATSLDDKKYEKAMEISSRTLTEYILYREKIIQKISEITDKDSEAKIHNLILPKRFMLNMNGDLSSIYSNNLWLLDDKYMTYTKALSERTMKEIIDEITDEKTETNNKKPDIAIIFSNNPKDPNLKSDVVIVELKKRGIKLARTEEVISQLKQRATKLMKYFPDKIQRIWFYGIVEFNDEFKLSLKNSQYTPLFSKDVLYYKEEPVYLSVEDDKPYLIGTYILSIDAFIEDAKARNATFLEILKDGFASF